MDQFSELLILPIDGPEISLIGYCEKLLQGDGFIFASGWLAKSDLTPIAQKLSLQIGTIPSIRLDALNYRQDIEAFGVAGGLTGFSVVACSTIVVAEISGLTVVLEDGSEHQIPLLASAVAPFRAMGELLEVSSRRVAGWVLDPGNWLKGTSPSLLLDGKFPVPVALLAAVGPSPTVVVDAHGAPWSDVGGVDFVVEFADILRHVNEQSFDASVFDGKVHQLALYSSDHNVASGHAVLEVPGRGRVEKLEKNAIVGWATPVSAKGILDIEVLWDGVLYTTVQASDHRDDLIRRGMTEEGGGFRYAFKSAPGDSRNGTVAARIRHTPTTLEAIGNYAVDLPAIETRLNGLHYLPAAGHLADVAIVIPIYNAAEDLRLCLESLDLHTTATATLILIDDASTDPRIVQILRSLRARAGVIVVSHEANLGFTATVNEGLAFAGRADVLLLNSDTIVGPRWLEQLRHAAYSDARIGTATAISNNAGAFSVPNIGTNKMPDWMAPEDCARLAAQASGGIYPSVPTGNGFCMYIRRDCIDEVGAFDVDAFPRGYGEENDFCLRALRKGFVHLIDDRTYVFHRRSASFGDEKKHLYEQGRLVIAERYPEYAHLTSIYSSHPTMLSVRWRVRRALRDAAADLQIPLPRVLFVVSTQTGGTPQTNRDLMENLADRYECWLLRSDSETVELSRASATGNVVVEKLTLRAKIQMGVHQSAEYDAAVELLLLKYSFELVHIRHIAWHGLGLPDICRKLGVPTVFSFHDFYTVCPTVKLLDNDLKFCGGTCTSSEGECRAELWPAIEQPPLKHRFVHRWRAMMDKAVGSCDVFVTTSPAAADVITRHLPSVAAKTIQVIPHGRSFGSMGNVTQTPNLDRSLRVLVPGNLDLAKGAGVCNALADMDARRELELHIMGDPGLLIRRPGMIIHGRYQRDEFLRKAAEIAPHIGAIFSIWPETYCHTLTEMWAAGIPVVAFDLGAVGERIREHGGGWLLPADATPREVYEAFLRIRRDHDDIVAKHNKIQKWQSTYGRLYDARAMADRYDLLYRKIQSSRRSFSRPDDHDVPVVLVVSPYAVQSDRQAPASTHIRIVEPTLNSPGRQILFRHSQSIQPIIDDVGTEIDAVLVQRDAISPEDVDRFIDRCREKQIKIIVDCDDDLVSVPGDKDADGRYSSGRDAFRRLLHDADHVTVSTDELRRLYGRINSNVTTVPNTLSDRLWKRELAAASPSAARKTIRALYMGTITHDADLTILREAVGRIKTQYPNFEFCVIGGQRTTEAWFERLDGPETPRNYPDFVAWFRSEAQNLDFAVAPLEDTAFNRCKSDLKFLDYSAAGLPAIYSDVPSYNQTVTDSITGVLARNTVDAWVSAMEWMIANPTERAHMAARARKYVFSSRSARHPGLMLERVLRNMLGSRGDTPASATVRELA